MKRNLISLFFVLIVVAFVARLPNEETKHVPQGSATPTSATNRASPSPDSQEWIVEYEGPSSTLGYQVVSIALGTSRQEVETNLLGSPSKLTEGYFPNGLRGTFCDYPDQMTLVAYDKQDRVAAIGGRSLILPDGSILEKGSSEQDVLETLGPAGSIQERSSGRLLLYPALGISVNCVRRGDRMQAGIFTMNYPW